MAAGETTLRFSVQVAADQADAALKALTVAFNQAGVAAKQSFVSLSGGAASAERAVGGLHGAVTRFAQQQRSEARVARFYAAELAQIIPVSNDVKNALTTAMGAMVGGGILGSAIAGIQLLALAWRSSAEAAKKAAEEARKVAKEIDKIVSDTGMRLARSEFILSGGDPKKWDAAMDRMEKESAIQDTINAQLRARLDAEQRLAEFRDAKGSFVTPEAGTMQAQRFANALGDWAVANENMIRLQGALRQAWAAGANEVKIAEDAARKTEEHTRYISAEMKFAADQAAIFARNMLEVQGRAAQLRREMFDQPVAEAKANRAPGIVNPGFGVQLSKEALEAKKAMEDAAQQTQRMWESVAQSIGAAFASMFTQMIFNAKNAADAAKSFFTSIFSMFLQIGMSRFFGGLFPAPAVKVAGGGLHVPAVRSGGGAVNLTINAVDSRSFVQLAEDNPDAILRPLRAAMANRRF